MKSKSDVTKPLTKVELFKQYRISGSSNEKWEPTPDNWMSVEIFREMHDGRLPEPDDTSLIYILKFLDKTKDVKYFFSLKNNGSMFLTAKRMVYRYADQIVAEVNDLLTEDDKPSTSAANAPTPTAPTSVNREE